MTSTQTVTEALAHSRMMRFVAMWEDGDMDAVDEVFSADVTYHAPPFPDMTRAELRDFVTAFREGFHGFRVEPREDVVSASTSVHRWSCEGTFAGRTSMLPAEPTGQRTTATGALVFHWTDGQVSEAWHFGDWLGWLTQAGVIPPLEG